MGLFKYNFSKKAQLWIIPALVISCCLLGMVSFALLHGVKLSSWILVFSLSIVACAFTFVSMVALSKHREDESKFIFNHRHIHANATGHTENENYFANTPLKMSSTDLENQIKARRYMEMLLRAAIANNEFTLLFQPKMSTRTGRICGAEALLRWCHPALGWFSPSEFIPIAEETGLIIPLGHWVMKTVCEKLKKWHDMGFGHLKISVNLSAYQFKKGDLVVDLANILWDTQLSPYSLELELTETVLMDNAEKYVLMLNVLKSMGISISIDDFGTGYSSLSYLKRFPIDALKIDKSFVNNIGDLQEDDTIINAIIAMAKGLNIKTIAEGIETKEQANYLIAQEVDELQGFYISLPLTEDELTARLEADSAKIEVIKH